MGRIAKKKSNDIHSARGRLKGVLQVIVNASDEDESGNESSDKKSSSVQGRSRSSRGRPPKKISKSDTPPPVLEPAETTAAATTSNTTTTTTAITPTDTVSSNSKSSESKQGNGNALHESFVMKLFDRSLDLAKYDEHTPLYPICRAWLLNQPRSNDIKSFKNRKSPSPVVREKNMEIWKKVLNGSNIDVDSLPAPKSLKIPRAPSPLDEQKGAAMENIDINYDINSPKISKENLLDLHKKRWVKLRNKWSAHLKARQQKYVMSNEILEAIYKPHQE